MSYFRQYPRQYGFRNPHGVRETVQSACGQGGDDVHVVDGESQVGVG